MNITYTSSQEAMAYTLPYPGFTVSNTKINRRYCSQEITYVLLKY